MLYLDYAKRRYEAAIKEIERLEQSEFPYTHIRDVLLQLKTLFAKQLAYLNKPTEKSSADIAKNACSQSLTYLFRYSPFLGFILHATNVRNSFELYAPLLRLAHRLLEPTTKLILSSEWEYSPFVYLPTSDLPGCVLIGIPALESANPLLVSLAGHELGHNIWNVRNLESKFENALRDEVVKVIKTKFMKEFKEYCPSANDDDLASNMFAINAWLPALTYAKRQLEEVFCDIMGLQLFAEAYLHSFAYLLSPCLPGRRTPFYPTTHARAKYMSDVAASMDVSVPTGYNDLFDTQDLPSSYGMDIFDTQNSSSSHGMDILVRIADTVVDANVDAMKKEVQSFAASKEIPKRSHENVNKIASDFRKIIPTDDSQPLTDVINAGWILFHDKELWKNMPQIKAGDRQRILCDLILKSCEVGEFRERVNSQ